MARDLKRSCEQYYDAAVIPVDISTLLGFSRLARARNIKI